MLSPNDLLRDLVQAFPREHLIPATIAIYERELNDLSVPELASAIRLLIRTEERFPTVATIRRTVAESRLVLPTPEEALGQIESGVIVDAATKQILQHLGGLYAFRHSTEPGVFRGQFLRLYRETRDKAIRDAQIGDLVPGIPAITAHPPVPLS